MQRTTGIFGGSFNPIHLGHTGLARYLVESGHVDEVWLMVSPHNPLKASATLVPEADRLRMAEIAVEKIPGVEASAFEFALPRPNYTAHTLRRLAQAYPDRRFSLIIGEDNWRVFGLWREYAYILRHYPLLVYPRSGEVGADGGQVAQISRTEMKNALSVEHVSAPEFPYSATAVRHALQSGDSRAAEMIDADVLAYIRAKDLYKTL